MRYISRTAFTFALVTSFGLAQIASAQTVRGEAELAMEKPITKVEGKTVITVLTVKNLSAGPIRGLKVSEFWYDKAGNSAPGATVQLRLPLAAGAVKKLTLKTPWTSKMESNKYQFSHANGTVKTRTVAKLE